MLGIVLGTELALSALSGIMLNKGKYIFKKVTGLNSFWFQCLWITDRSLAPFSLADEFCLGQSREMSLVLYSYQGGNEKTIQKERILLLLSLVQIVLVTSVEFAIYRKLMAGNASML